DVLHPLAGVAGQLLGEIAKHLGRHLLAQLAKIRLPPGLLNRAVDRLESAEVRVAHGGVNPAVLLLPRCGCSADRARHRATPAGKRKAAPAKQPDDEKDQEADDQDRQQPAEHLAETADAAAEATEQHRAEEAAGEPA